MKKFLSVLISAAILTTMLAVPVYADSSNSSVSDTTNEESTAAPYVPLLPVKKTEDVPADAIEISMADSISTDGTYVLVGDITETITIGNGKNVTIYLNGYNISVTSGYAINNAGTLTVIGTGKDKISAGSSVGIYNVSTDTPPKLTLSNCTVEGKTYGIRNQGTATVDNCKIYAEIAGVYNVKGNMKVTLMASDSIFYGTGNSDAGYGIQNGYDVTNRENLEATLTDCWLGGYVAGAKNEGVMTLNNCDRYYDFADLSGAAGRSLNVVDNSLGNLTVTGGFTQVGGRITGGNMDIQNVTGGKLIPSGGNTVTIKKCELDRIDCSNTQLYSPAQVTIEDVTLKSINYSVYGGEGLTADVTLKNVTAAEGISLTGTSTPHDFRMEATITGCTAETLSITDNAGATVSGGSYKEITFYNANSNRATTVAAPVLNIKDAEVGTLNAGIDAMNCNAAALNIQSGTTVDMLSFRGRQDDVNSMKTSVTVGKDATVKDYRVSVVDGQLLQPKMTIEQGAILGVDKYITYDGTKKLVNYLGDYCGEGMTLTKNEDGTYSSGVGTTDKSESDKTDKQYTFVLHPNGKYGADNRLWIAAYIDGTDQQIEDGARLDGNTRIRLVIQGKYSEIYSNSKDDGKNTFFNFKQDDPNSYISIDGNKIYAKSEYKSNTDGFYPIEDDSQINDSEKYFGIKSNGDEYEYVFTLKDMDGDNNETFLIVPHVSVLDEQLPEGFKERAEKSTLTEDNGVYEIKTADDLYKISYLSLKYESFKDKTIKLMNNIDMEDCTDYIPIGAYTVFNGTFDGQSCEISNFHYKSRGCWSQYGSEYNDRVDYSNTGGIFGRVSGGTIKNLKMTGAEMTGVTKTVTHYENAGTGVNIGIGATETDIPLYGAPLCGQANDTTFENINISNCKSDGAYFGAMLLGHTDGGVKILNSTVESCEFTRKWDDGGLFIGYSCGETILEECAANDSSCGAVFIGTPNVRDHYIINCSTKNVTDPDNLLAPFILEIRDPIKRNGEEQGRVFIRWDSNKADELNTNTDMRQLEEKHTDEASKMPDLGKYNDDKYAIAEKYTVTYADKVTSRMPKGYTTQKCYNGAGTLIDNMLEVVVYDHYLAQNELRYQTATQSDGNYALRLISECHTLNWDYVGYRVWVDRDGGDVDDFLNKTVFTNEWQYGVDQHMTNATTADLDESSRFVWHTLDGTKVKHNHADSWFFTRTITDIPKEIWEKATFVVQPYIIKSAQSDEENNGVPNAKVTVNGGDTGAEDVISFGAVSVITKENRAQNSVTNIEDIGKGPIQSTIQGIGSGSTESAGEDAADTGTQAID